MRSSAPSSRRADCSKRCKSGGKSKADWQSRAESAKPRSKNHGKQVSAYAHTSWVNLVECLFSILSKRGLAQSVHHSKQLKDFLLKFLAHYNDSCQPFTWTKGPEKLQRIIEATQQYQAEHPPKRKRRQQRRNNIRH